MSIRINPERCVGCKRCSEVCPGTLIGMNTAKKAVIRYPKDCWGCVSCVKECSAGAIEFYLADDMGGNDTWMQVSSKGQFLVWDFYHKQNKIRTIRVDRTSSNQY